MANIMELLVDKFKEFQASQEFDKAALIEAHEKTFKGVREMQSRQGYTMIGLSIRKPSEHWRPSVPLKDLRPIRARELQVDNHHHGRVLLGTLCAKAYKMVGIMTILEDQFGDAVRLVIYNVSPSKLDTDGPRKLYPKCSKVAVKQPYFKQGAQDGAFILRVDNPQDVEILASFPENAESSTLDVDLLELRNQGNKCFRDEDWSKAIDFYSKCIDLALSRDKIEGSASNIEEKVKEGLVYSYSNKAEAKLRLNKYGEAVEDCEKALALDPHHLKSLYRRGRAFHSLREYKLACQCFDKALEQAPTATDIQLLYERSKELNNQNEQGKFNLSPYLINGCNAPELSNYIGPVLIKKSVGMGRGLFATDDVDVGDFLVVDNAIACSSTEITRSKKGTEKSMLGTTQMKTKLDRVKQDLEAKIISSAVSSPRVLQQLEYLAGSDEMKVPPMDLFQINNTSWNNYDFPNQRRELDQHKLAKIMLNVGCRIHVTDSNSDTMQQNEQHGLWALPSFINHSCIPNANCTVVGEAMVIVAARKIAAGEEITIPYFNTFVPLFGRESVCMMMGFKCECKRCMLERPLVTAEGSPLQLIVQVVDSMDDTLLSDLDLWASAMQVETIIARLPTEEKQMIRASYFPLYLNIFGFGRIHPYACTTLPSLLEVFDGFQAVVPGNCVCLALFAKVPVHSKNSAEIKKTVFKKSLEVCRAHMGKHEEALLKGVLKSVAIDVCTPPFTVFGRTEVNS